MTMPSGGYPPGTVNPPVIPGDPTGGSELSEWAIKTQAEWEADQNLEVQAPWDMWATFSNVLQDTVNALIQAFNGNLIPLRDLVIALKPETPPWIDDLTDWVGEAIAYVTDVLDTIWRAIVGAFQSFGLKLKNTEGIPPPNEGHYTDPIFKPLIEEITRALNATHDTAEDAIDQIDNIDSIFNIPSSRALWQGIDGSAQSSIPLMMAMDTTNITAIQTISCGCAIRIAGTGAIQLIRIPCRYTGAVAGLNIDVYQLMPNDPALGTLSNAAVRKYTSENLVDELPPAAGWVDCVLAEGIPVQLGEIYLIQIRCSGSGTVTVNGAIEPNIAPVDNFRPKHRGWARPTGAQGNPEVIPIAEMDTFYNLEVPYVEIAMKPTDYEESPRNFMDDFSRTSLGPNYRHYLYNTSSKLGIVNGALTEGGTAATREAAPTGKVPFTSGAMYSAVLHGYSLISDHCRVEVRIQGYIYMKNGYSGTRIVICSNSNMTNFVAVLMNRTQLTLQVASAIGPESVYVTKATAAVALTDDEYLRIAVEYNPETNTYSVFLNDDKAVTPKYDPLHPICEWQDTTNLIAHGPGQRYYGTIHCTDLSTRGARVDTLWGNDIVIEEPDPPAAEGN